MCMDCGCEVGNTGRHGHDHTHHHGHGHGHDHDHDPVQLPGRTISLATRVMSRNDEQAARNRRWLDERGIRAINLISSPGAGKTLLLERTLERLQGRVGCAVIVGDLQTDHDAQRLQGRGAGVVQIETRNACHLDAVMVGERLPELLSDHGKERLLIIENVGNLVCPAAFDLGEHVKVALLSVTEGEDKPVKYPVLFQRSPVVVVTKWDLVPHLDWDRSSCRAAIRQVRPDARIFELSARTGFGLEAWIDFLEDLVT
ncbi:MAG: hydrogenase nickel incorporation protein HypB [Magnetococcales bacterium]|nr:hydrogenase nickel incorporation protein HypB [Magnetococcales bacterium]